MDDSILSPRETRRYAKQIMLPGIGLEGQEKLKKSKVLVIGAGGLGSPVLQYLTAAGIGTIGIAEFDTVDETNLQRQILYGTTDVGKLKSDIAKTHLNYLNPFVKLEDYNLKFDISNSIGIVKQYDIVVDATDNFESRYIINDACVILGKTMVHGAIYGYEGIISVFNYNNGATYRCYNPEKDDNFRNPMPKDVGLFGVLPGIVGTFMANEVIKVITGTGEILSGKILLINISNNTFSTFSVKNIPENHNIKKTDVTGN